MPRIKLGDAIQIVFGIKMIKDLVDGDTGKIGAADADEASHKAGDDTFGFKETTDIDLAGATSPENADFFGPFDHGDISDNRGHDGGDDKRD